MRIPIALAIYVSLVSGAFADNPAATPRAKGESTPEWTAVYDQGMAAVSRHSYEEALGLFERSWAGAHTAEERGATATDIGQTMRLLGRINDAKQWFETARLAWGEDPRESLKLAATASALADLDRSTGDYVAAERLLRDTLASPFCNPDSKGSLRNNLADLLREEGRTAEAETLFRQTLLQQPGEPATPWRQRVSALIGLADIDRLKGDWQASVNHWNEVLDISRQQRDKESEAIALRGLAMTWLDSGKIALAEPLLRRAIRLMENNPDTPPEQLASAHSSMGSLYRSENKLSLAENEWTSALQIDRTALGDVHPQVAWLMEMLSDVYSSRGEYGLARDYATRAWEMMRGSFGENSMPVATALTNRALVEQRASDLDAAAKDYERAIGIAHNHPEHRSIEAVMLQRYAELLKAMHRPREAKALDVQARSFQPR